MRIAQLLPYDADFHGGVREHVVHLSRELVRRGHEVTIFAPTAHATLDLDFPRAVPIHTQPLVVPANGSVARVIGPDVWAWASLLSLLLRERFDVIHLHEPMLWLPVVLTCPTDSTLVGTVHAAAHLGELGELARPAVSNVVERLDATIAVSGAARAFAASYGLSAEYAIPNGVDVEAFAASAGRDQASRSATPNLLFFGRLDERKGLDTLLSALPDVARAVPGLRLTIAGHFSADEAPAVRARALAADLGVDLALVSSPDATEKARLFRSASVLCSPAHGGESFGIVLAEALAAGLPIVASDLPGFREVLEDGRYGVLVPPRDSDQLGTALVHLLSDSTRRAELSQAGMARARQLSWHVVGERIERVYQELTPSGTKMPEVLQPVAA